MMVIDVVALLTTLDRLSIVPWQHKTMRIARAAPPMLHAAHVPHAPHRSSAAIIGGGPAGLLTAIMLSQRGWRNIGIFDARAAPPTPNDASWGVGDRSYQLGLNGRGQQALREFGAFDRVSAYSASVNGRLSFDEQGQPTESRLTPPGEPGAEKTYVTRVLQRDRLQACLLEELQVNHPHVKIEFGVACEGVDVSDAKPSVRICAAATAAPEDGEIESCVVPSEQRAFDLVVGADGVRSSVRESLAALETASTRTVRFDDNNERRYKTLPLHPSAVPGTAADLNWGARNRTLDLGMDALPTVEGEMVAVLLVKPSSPVYDRLERLTSAAEARTFFCEALPAIVPYLRDDDLERFVARPISRLPSFQLVEGDVHAATSEGGVVLLGDAIKAVKPYFGQGANSALEDVSVLRRCLEACGDDPAAAAAAFSAARAEDARALVRTSRAFDGRGPLGTARFLLPLLLDIQLTKLLPAVFTPPMLRGLQDERNSFTGLRKRKRLERTLLVGMLGAFLTCGRAVVRLLV